MEPVGSVLGSNLMGRKFHISESSEDSKKQASESQSTGGMLASMG